MIVRVGSPYAKLEPDMWRNILARAAVFDAARARLSELSDHDDRGGIVQGALRDLEMSALEYATNDADDETTVRQVVAAWSLRLTDMLSLTHLDLTVRELLTAVHGLSQAARWDDPFQRIFAGVTKLAQGTYGESWREVTLEVAHIGSPPRQGGDPYAVTALTPWPPDDDPAEVHLRIHCARFGPAAYAALPLLLIHECICHVPARQNGADNNSTFAEGLLDWVAYDFHERWAAKLDPALAPAARWHANSLRAVLRQADSEASRARALGHRAAEQLQVWFEVDREQHSMEARLSVVKLAVELNQVYRPLTDKDRFVSLLGAQLPPILEAALRDWDSGLLEAEELLAVAVPA